VPSGKLVESHERGNRTAGQVHVRPRARERHRLADQAAYHGAVTRAMRLEARTDTKKGQPADLAWTQMLALAGAARRREPKRLRLRLFSIAGRLASSGRRLWLRLAERWPWTAEITAAAARPRAILSG
jgi:hypothetical protein